MGNIFGATAAKDGLLQFQGQTVDLNRYLDAVKNVFSGIGIDCNSSWVTAEIVKNNGGIMKRLIGILFVLSLLCTGQVFAASATLTWTPNTEADLEGYKIYRGTGACTTGPLQPLMANGTHVQVGKVSTYTDTTIPQLDGTTVCYEITAFDTAQNESPRSNRASKVINVIPPLAPVGLTINVIP